MVQGKDLSCWFIGHDLISLSDFGQVECCLRFPENYTPTSFEPKTLRHVDDHCDEDQQMKLRKRKKCEITDQLVELPIEQQIYDLIHATSTEGLTRVEVCALYIYIYSIILKRCVR